MFTTAIILPYIDPIALNIGFINIHWYGLSYLSGIILGWLYLKSKFVSSCIGDSKSIILSLSDLIPWIVFGILLGGRVGYVLIYNPIYFIENPIEIFKVWNGGMSFHGGLLGIIIAIYFFSKKNSKSFLSFMDLIAISAPIGIFFGRLSNFINTELIGTYSDLPWSVIYPNDSVSRHPSQIYEALLEGLILFLILAYLSKRNKILHDKGMASAIFLIIYGTFRIFLELFRLPDQHIGYILANKLTMGMIVSIPMILVGLILYKNIKKDE